MLVGKFTFKLTPDTPKGRNVTQHAPTSPPARAASSLHPALRPQGFTPLVGSAAAKDRALVSALLSAWAEQGFEQIAPIQVDEAEILLSDQSSAVQNRTFRFLDPQSGRLLALLSDVTLGVARLAQGELADAPRPLRLSYEGQAIRTQGSPSRPTRQFGQVGVELIGVQPSEISGLIELAISSLHNLGLTDLSLSLALPTFAQACLDSLNLSPADAQALAQALDRKDEGKVRTLGGSQADELIDLMTGQASQALASHPALTDLRALAENLTAKFPDLHTTFEPFEQRGFAFQTGPCFALYAKNLSGEVGRGGAYMCGTDASFGFTLYRDSLLAALS